MPVRHPKTGSNTKKSHRNTFDERALQRCGFGIRQLLVMEDEAIFQAKENDVKRVKKEITRIKIERSESGTTTGFMRGCRLDEETISPHPILGPVIIDRARKFPIKVRALINFAGNSSDLEAMGIEVHSSIHDVFTITATKKQLAELASQPATSRINLPRKFLWTLSEAVPQAEMDHIHAVGTMGQGTIVGLLDSTLDVKHHAFRDQVAPHNTRILYLWVQDPERTLDGADPPGETPQQYSLSHPGAPDFSGLHYGRIYDAGAINTAIGLPSTYGTGANQIATETPDQTSIDRQHGTHTTGIAAGSGLDATWNPGPDIGAAPHAAIVFIAYDLNEDHALDAMNFIFEISRHLNRPVAVNLSFGTGRGPHDGKSDFDTALDNMLFSFNGRSIVCGAGNENTDQAFRKGTINAGQTEPSWDMSISWPGTVILTIWYSGPELDHRIRCGGQDTDWKTAGQEYHSHYDNGAIQDGAINGYEIHTYRDIEPRADLRSILIWIPQASQVDDWTIELRNISGTSEVTYWAWLDNGVMADLEGFTQDELTLSDIACGMGVLTVGVCEKPSGGNPEMIWDGSGCGPTRDRRIKPEITVVGCDIASAESGSSAGYVSFSGSSMAAPLVTGAIALLLERNPTLNQDTIKGLLTQTADRTGLEINPDDTAYDPMEHNQYGFGRLRMLAPFQHTLPLVDVDVWVRTAYDDYGDVPYIGECFCNAPEVSVYDSSNNEVNTLYWNQEHRVTVRVHNLGDSPAFNTIVRLKYTRPWAAPDDWVACQDSSNSPIETPVDIPALGYVDVEFTQRWKPEESEIPSGGEDWGNHYCLLVELDNVDSDPLRYNDSSAEGRDAWNRNIKGTNNVALLNLNIL